MKLNEITLGEHVIIKSSKRVFLKDYVPSGIPFYRSKEIILLFNNKPLDDKLYISNELYNSIKTKYGVPQKNDILLTSVGTLGVPYLIKDDDKFYFKDGNLTWFSEFNLNELDPEFLYYWIQSNEGVNKLRSISIGSTQKALTMDSLKKIKFLVPPVDYQVRVVNILKTIDDKIKNNLSIIKKLEEISNEIFKHWFIDFDFPNDQGQPYKSSGGEMVESEMGIVPQGFSITTIMTIAEIIMGQSPKGDTYNQLGEGLPLVNGAADFKNGLIVPNKFTNDPKKVARHEDYIFGVRATIGDVTFVDKEYAIGRGAGIARFKERKYKEFLYFVLEEAFNKFAKTSSGSVYLNVSGNDLKSIKIVLPDETVINKFSRTVKPLFEMSNSLRRQNLHLQNLRDTLLPKLLTGEIEVPLLDTE